MLAHKGGSDLPGKRTDWLIPADDLQLSCDLCKSDVLRKQLTTCSSLLQNKGSVKSEGRSLGIYIVM
jgi:hypothetical protein